MKKILFSAITAFMLFSCQNDQTDSSESNLNAASRRGCASQEVLEAQLKADPMLAIRMNEIEAFTNKSILTNRLVNGKIEIPVVVNVLYRTAAQNISNAQIQSQIDVLNADFNNTNSDLRKVPSVFTSSVGKAGVRFVLLNIVRKATNVVSWPPTDAMKKSFKGGIDPTDPHHNLNMWACNLGYDLLGYAQFPNGNSATDGVVILYSAFGSRSIYHQGTYIKNYDLGRTASHEVGHWMNLYHIWGDDGGSCNGSDRVDDTPNQANYNFGCPDFPHITCSNNGDMSMNYMDYTDDACMYMFTQGQVNRMLAVFSPKGPRAAIGQR